MASDFTVRIGEPDDHRMVYKFTADKCRFVPYYVDLDAKSYTNMINTVVAKMLKDWTLLIAFVTAVPAEAAGFIVCKPGKALGTLFVKPDYRRKGVARLLLQASRLGARFPTVLGSPRAFKLAREKGLEVQFSPYFGIMEDVTHNG